MIERSIGAAPRQRGSSEGWTFSIGHSESDRLRLGSAHPLDGLGVVDVHRLQQIDAEVVRRLSDRRRLGVPPASAGTVRRRDDERWPVDRLYETAQDVRGELRRAEVDDPHAVVFGSRCSPASAASSSSSSGGL
jgi:hypothetical protein